MFLSSADVKPEKKKKKKKKKSRLMQIEKPSQAGSQTKEGEPHCSSLHICFGGISEVFCCDAQWAQMNTESESCVWEWVSAECLFFWFSSGNGNNLTLFLGGVLLLF